MTLSEELTWRGFIHQTTFANLMELDDRTWTFYHGFDASADSQTIGNLAAMMFDKVLLRHGHKGIILAGGATSMIGDPGGKDKERPLQDEATIRHNVERAKQQLERVLSGHDFTLVNNLDWTKKLNVLTFLRDIGKHYSMTPLVQRDYIAKRIGESGGGISYAEFSYTILQGMDFLHLYDNYGCTLQLGGSDQWGNCLSGVELVRKARGAEAHVITLPLIINKATGKKFGKSEEGAVWLDADKTTPTQFYQFWINTDDEGAEGYLKVYTELDKQQIEDILIRHRENHAERYAQTALAREVTKLVHGDSAMQFAETVTGFLTGHTPIGDADDKVLEELRTAMSSVTAQSNGSIVEALTAAGLATSNTEARRLLTGNAISINGHKITREQFEPGDFNEGRLLIRRGKAFKDTALVESN